jgi:hypothetical protein
VNPHYFTCSFQIQNLKIKKTHQSTGSEEKFGNLFFVSVSVCGYRMGCCLLMFWVWKLWLCVYLKMDFEWWLWRWYFDERLKMKIAALLCCLFFCIFCFCSPPSTAPPLLWFLASIYRLNWS